MPSLTINSSPSGFTPAYNPMQFTVTSTNTAECNFQYVCDIYVETVFITRLFLFPNIAGKGVFEINRIIQNQLGIDFNYQIDTFTEAPNSYCKYQVKFGEKYDTSTACDGSSVQLVTDIASSSVQYAWNGSFNIKDFSNYDQADWITNSSSPPTLFKFLTNQPKQVSITPGDYAQLTYIQSSSNPVHYMRMYTYDYQGNIQYQNSLVNTMSPVVIGLVSIPTGYENLQAAKLAGLLTGTGANIFNDDSAYYEIWLEDVNRTRLTEIKRYNINRERKINTVRYYWLGLLGNMDSYTFTKINNHTLTIDKNEYTKLNRSAVPTSRGRENIYSRIKDHYQSTSGYISEKEAKWLNELFTSTSVYIIPENHIYCFYMTSVADGSHIGDKQLHFLEDISDLEIGEIIWVNTSDNLTSWAIEDIDYDNKTLVINFNDLDESCGQIANAFGDKYDLVPLQIPIIITETQYMEKTKRMLRNINYTINYELSSQNIIQHN